MFMRAVLSEEARVGLLLFDEPSAALDPTAEHGTPRSVVFAPLGVINHLTGHQLDLFTRIRKLRGEKTMIFSSHRFGQLTKPADLIMYVARALDCTWTQAEKLCRHLGTWMIRESWNAERITS